MKIYTKTGDNGTTGLFNGARVSKSSLRVETYGTVDELNSIIGLTRTENTNNKLESYLSDITVTLFNLGSDLATPLNPPPKFGIKRIEENDITKLEKYIDEFDEILPPLKNFILPGGSKAAAYLHNARTVCRRAERLAVELASVEEIGEYVVRYLNRLSDFLFTAARYANHTSGIKDVEWKS